MAGNMIDRLLTIGGQPVNVRLVPEDSVLKVLVSTPKPVTDPPLDAGDIDVRLTVGAQELHAVSSPSGTLPETHLKGATAHALYEFEFPEALRSQGTVDVRASYKGVESSFTASL